VRAALVFAFLVIAATAAADDDDKPEVHKFRFIERGANLTITANPTPLAKLFDSEAYEALHSGFTSTIVIRIWIYPKGSTDAVGYVLLKRQVVWAVWDEVYELMIDGRASTKEKRQSEAFKKLTAIDELPVALLKNVPYEQVFYLAMQVELNPVSPETLAEVRRWLSQGTGGGLDRGGAFFGSFVSVFVNPKIPAADRVLRIRSQPFYRPKP
jgi:hypothetical protein